MDKNDFLSQNGQMVMNQNLKKMKKMSYFKMVLVSAALYGGTLMSAQENAPAGEGLIASANTESLNYLKFANNKVVTTNFVRNNVNYQLLEQPGTMMMYYAKGTFTVSYTNASNGKLAFRLVDGEGNIVYADKIKKGMYHERIKTADLPAGSYTAFLVAEDDYYEKRFDIK